MRVRPRVAEARHRGEVQAAAEEVQAPAPVRLPEVEAERALLRVVAERERVQGEEGAAQRAPVGRKPREQSRRSRRAQQQGSWKPVVASKCLQCVGGVWPFRTRLAQEIPRFRVISRLASRPGNIRGSIAYLFQTGVVLSL